MSKKNFKSIGANIAMKFITQPGQEYQYGTQQAHVGQAAPMAQIVKRKKNTQEVQEVRKAQLVQEVQYEQKTQGRKGKKKSRINMAFCQPNLEYLQTISRIAGVSITAYVNRLIDADRESTADIIGEAEKMLKKMGRRITG